MIAAGVLREILGIDFEPEFARDEYIRGWGPSMVSTSPIACSWKISMQDKYGKPVALDFDLTNDNVPLNICMDV